MTDKANASHSVAQHAAAQPQDSSRCTPACQPLAVGIIAPHITSATTQFITNNKRHKITLHPLNQHALMRTQTSTHFAAR
jgi:hypothetical protein